MMAGFSAFEEEVISFICDGEEVQGLSVEKAISAPDILNQAIAFGALENVATSESNEVTITEYSCEEDEVVIPSKIDNKYVTKIGTLAFNGKELTSITLPNKLKNIDIQAFLSNRLTSITIPNSVQSIGAYAFSSNSSLITITIDKTSGSIEGSPWGASNADIIYLR